MIHRLLLLVFAPLLYLLFECRILSVPLLLVNCSFRFNARAMLNPGFFLVAACKMLHFLQRQSMTLGHLPWIVFKGVNVFIFDFQFDPSRFQLSVATLREGLPFLGLRLR